MTGDQLLPLPRQVRPSAAETAERYVHRLAEANHLRPSYLRLLLTTPPNSLGPIQLDKLAALAGRDPANLVRALPELVPRTRTPGRSRENEARKTLNEQRKRERFAAIRYDARLGMSIRALATKHHVGRRTVGKALQSEIPPPRKKIERQPTVLLGLREHIDAMLEANPAITAAAIWQRLHDEHDATPSYPAVRTYITTRRTARLQRPRLVDEPPTALAIGRPTNAPPAAATEEATVRLLHLAFLEIRLLTASIHNDQLIGAADQRRKHANEIADICHDLISWLAPHRRDDLADGLRHQWRTANTRQRRWLQTRLEQLGYDHHWLTDLPPDTSPPARNRP
ncbi:hypothetical protein [Paractinoplanes rishiriensis]|uniref:Uncharacterized protein n=1 Tax=Paractinoplanes rishiriensis TaxID=1050105 RepID=A0A919K9M3_9ACTN|nr:hypothetical protein [Actinoplanes rishiriensis]GIF02315.1 hypothetical protein Ari01nite_97790 [Actinoplanes rishiriensis]